MRRAFDAENRRMIGYRGLADAMLYVAVKGLKDQSSTDHYQSVLWLASTDATKYFDLRGYDQLCSLRALGWINYAEALIRNGLAVDEDADYLREGINTVAL